MFSSWEKKPLTPHFLMKPENPHWQGLLQLLSEHVCRRSLRQRSICDFKTKTCFLCLHYPTPKSWWETLTLATNQMPGSFLDVAVRFSQLCLPDQLSWHNSTRTSWTPFGMKGLLTLFMSADITWWNTPLIIYSGFSYYCCGPDGSGVHLARHVGLHLGCLDLSWSQPRKDAGRLFCSPTPPLLCTSTII